MSNKRQLFQWLEEVSHEEQDVPGPNSADEMVNDTAINNTHDSESEIEQFEDIQYIPQPLNGNYFLSRHIQRNDPKVSKFLPSDAVRIEAQNIVFHLLRLKEYARNTKYPLEYFQLLIDSDVIELLVTNTN